MFVWLQMWMSVLMEVTSAPVMEWLGVTCSASTCQEAMNAPVPVDMSLVLINSPVKVCVGYACSF